MVFNQLYYECEKRDPHNVVTCFLLLEQTKYEYFEHLVRWVSLQKKQIKTIKLRQHLLFYFDELYI